MEPRIIKTEKQYERYLAEVAQLAARDPDIESEEGGRLELVTKLGGGIREGTVQVCKARPRRSVRCRVVEVAPLK